jgi:hypothetical protein
MRKSTIAIGIAAALSTQAFVTTTSADAAVKVKPQKASGPVHQTAHFKYPNHTSPTGGSTLYDQSGTSENGFPAQNFSSTYDQYDAQGADDFVVTDAAGWNVSGFNFQILPGQTGTDLTTATWNIQVYPDAGGLPGASAVCSYPTATGVPDSVINGTSVSVSLPSTCSLPQGTYWVSMMVNLDFVVGGQVFWALDSRPAVGSDAAWQNPGGGFGLGCTTWTDNATCLAGSGLVTAEFQVIGSVGGGNSCGAGQLCLVSTVGSDLTPDACATTDTIDATQGDQLNFCYTVTNNTSVELDYHTLANNVDGTLFSLLNQPLAPGASYQYNHIENVTATNTYNSTWTAQDVPPGYLATPETGSTDCSDRIYADGFDGTTPGCGGAGGFIDISGTGTALGNGDDESIAVSMPFSFNFYGTSSSNLCVDNNGFILFNAGSCPTSGFYNNASLPSASFTAPAILPLWDDFDSESGNVYTDIRGTSPNRQFIVEWYQRAHFSGNSDTATFEVIFDEADGALHFWYDDVDYTAAGNVSGDPDVCDGGVCATIGLQNNPGLFNQYSAFEASVTNGGGIAWTATTPQVFTATDSVTVNVGAPDINVTPPSITGTVAAGGTASTIMDIQNLGNRDLNWTADEAPPPDSHFPIGPRYAPSTLRPGETNVGRIRPSQEYLRAHGRGGMTKGAHHVSHPLGATTPSFGCNIISSSACEFVSLDADNPGTLNNIAQESELMFGATFVNNDFTKEYVVGYPSGDLQTIDTTTGALVDIGSTGQGTATRDIAYDSTTGTTFGTAISGDLTDLFTVDTTTGTMTAVGTITGVGEPSYVMGLAVDPSNGLMYGIEIVSSSLIAIDKTTGAGSVIGPLGYSTRFGQGLDFNAATHTLYLASIDYGAGGQNMYTVDLTSGHATLIGPIGNNIIQLGSFGIAVPNGPCGQPADQPWFSLNPTSGTTAGGDDSPVTVSVDATGTSDGDVLSGTICVRSNDPDEATVAVPITYTVGGTGPGTIVDSGPINLPINPDLTGLYINWLTGDYCSSSGGACSFDGYDYNPWDTPMLYFWPGDNDGNCLSTDGTVCDDLASGAVVGPSAAFGTGDPSSAVEAGGTFIMGFSFINANTSQVNYGYVKITTTGPNGTPATLNEYWYDNSGAAITVP